VTNLSPFGGERADIAADEARLLQSFTVLARERMVSTLARLGIARPTQNLSARWGAETALRMADIAISELSRENLSGYGAVDDASASELTALVVDVRETLARAKQLFHEHDAGGLSGVLATLPGVVGDVLRAIDEISRSHALAEIRPLLAAAAERAVATTFDVGVFGRVSAGKSSFINSLVGDAVLPVGITPVTAVPVRLTRGPRRGLVHFLDGKSVTIDLGDIAKYATEQQNPDNRLNVHSIEASVPSVPEGLRLLDTPGVGSLRSGGSALAFKWLPRCDLGLVLVAAASAVGRDELALVTGLRHAGITCIILLSKSDLLSDTDSEKASEYLRREVSRASASDGSIEVRAISTVAGADAGLSEFRQAVLAPLARDHARVMEHAQFERLRRLIDATAAAMSGGLAPQRDAALHIQRARARAMDRLREEVTRIEASTPAILEGAAEALATAWQAGEDGQQAVRQAVIRHAGNALGMVDDLLASVRQAADGEAWKTRRIPPLFDPEFLDALPPLPPPRLARRRLGQALAKRRLTPLAHPLAEAVQRYASRLFAWATGALEELGEAAWESSGLDAHSVLPPELKRLRAMVDDLSSARQDASPTAR
jgi:GTPase Era involved in 16S rRNA processing